MNSSMSEDDVLIGKLSLMIQSVSNPIITKLQRDNRLFALVDHVIDCL